MPDGLDAARGRRATGGATPIGGSSGAANSHKRDPRLATATQAYDDALHSVDRQFHLHPVDTLVATRRNWPNATRMNMNGAAPKPKVSRVIHEVGSPYKTSFKLGFGFTAGAWSFRAILQLVVFGALIIAAVRLLSFVTG
jgi:hypothetical protein